MCLYKHVSKLGQVNIGVVPFELNTYSMEKSMEVLATL